MMMLTGAGIAPLDGVNMLADDEKDKEGAAVMKSIAPPLEKGKPLSFALRESKYFPKYMVSMLEAGEETGRVPETLRSLANHYERQERLTQTLRNAVMYPAVLLVLMLAVVVLLVVKVLPMFNEVFARLGSRLPPLADALMTFGRWLSGASVVIAIIVGVVLAVAFLAWLIPSVRTGLGRWFRNTFGGKGIMWELSSSRFASVLAMSVASGLETEKALNLAHSISGDSKAAETKHKECIDLIRGGATMADAMQQTGIFSVRNSRMLALGTRSGMTDTAMAEIADRSSRAVQDQIDRIVSKVEPALVITTSVIIGVILLSVMLPLMGIMTALG
jgi:type IV pilus assembly protein PilC